MIMSVILVVVIVFDSIVAVGWFVMPLNVSKVDIITTFAGQTTTSNLSGFSSHGLTIEQYRLPITN